MVGVGMEPLEGQVRQAGQEGLSEKVAWTRDLNTLRMRPWRHLAEENSTTWKQPV